MTVGDFGQPFAIKVPGVDLTLMDTVTLTIVKPDGTRVTWGPVTKTSDLITYTIASGDLDQSGTYTGDVVLTWGILVDPPGHVTSSIFTLTVDPGV